MKIKRYMIILGQDKEENKAYMIAPPEALIKVGDKVKAGGKEFTVHFHSCVNCPDDELSTFAEIAFGNPLIVTKVIKETSVGWEARDVD